MLKRVWRKKECSCTVGNATWYSHYGRWYGDCLKKLGIKAPYDPAIPLLGIYPEETKIGKDECIQLFIAALFTIARAWKQPRCPLTDEWIKKLWCIHTMEYYSTIKRSAFESVLMTWINLEPIIQSETSQKEKDNCLLRKLYAGQEATVRTGHGTTDWFQIGKGVVRLYIVTLLI